MKNNLVLLSVQERLSIESKLLSQNKILRRGFLLGYRAVLADSTPPLGVSLSTEIKKIASRYPSGFYISLFHKLEGNRIFVIGRDVNMINIPEYKHWSSIILSELSDLIK